MSSTEALVTPPHSSGSSSNAALLGTPSNPGMQSVASVMQRHNANDTREKLWGDVSTSRLTSFEMLLYHNLILIGAIENPDGTASGAQAATESTTSGIKEPLKAVEYCLEKLTTKISTMARNGCYISKIVKNLTKYGNCTTETARYPFFVKAVNEALRLLQPLSIGNSRPCGAFGKGESLIFMINDPKTVPSFYGDTKYRTKPDIVAVEAQDARAFHGITDNREVESLLESVATKCATGNNLAWSQILLCVEQKRICSKVTWPQSLQKYTMCQHLSRTDPIAGVEPQVIDKWDILMNLHEVDPQVASRIQESAVSESSNKALDSKHQAVPKIPEVVQFTHYAMEGLRNSLGRRNIMSVLVADNRLSAWYHDHESSIQAKNIDVYKDVSYFLLYLFTIQRFSRTDWGFEPSFEDLNDSDPDNNTLTVENVNNWRWPDSLSSNAVGNTPVTVNFVCEKDKVKYPPPGINGRSTAMIPFKAYTIGDPNAPGPNQVKGGAIKLAWCETSRKPETYYINQARIAFSVKSPYHNVCDCLPDIIGTKDFEDFSTRLVREQVSVLPLKRNIQPNSGRVLSLMMTPEYLPITHLIQEGNWEEFSTAFLDLIYYHAMLWMKGIQHGDISIDNLMWDPVNKKAKLCDFHLSRMSDDAGPTGNSRTATQLFMAEELLSPLAMSGDIRRLYRHDLESFIYCLGHIVLENAEGGVERLRDWKHGKGGFNVPRRSTMCALEDRKPSTELLENTANVDIWEACKGFVVYAWARIQSQTGKVPEVQLLDEEEYTQEVLAANTPRFLQRCLPLGKDRPNPGHDVKKWSAVGCQKIFDKWDKVDVLLEAIEGLRDEDLIKSESLIDKRMTKRWAQRKDKQAKQALGRSEAPEVLSGSLA